MSQQPLKAFNRSSTYFRKSFEVKINIFQTLSTRFGHNFEVECLVEVKKLNLSRDSEASFGQDIEV